MIEHWGVAANTGGLLPSPAAHLWLRGLVPDKPWTGTDLGVGPPVPEAASPLVYTRTCIFTLVSLLFPSVLPPSPFHLLARLPLPSSFLPPHSAPGN